MHSVSELSQPPSDGITATVFANHSNNLLATSWDETVRYYNVNDDRLLQKFDLNTAVLDGALAPDDKKAYVGCLNGIIYMIDFTSGEVRELGCHGKELESSGIKCIEYCHASKLFVSAGWDQKMKLWDPRAMNACANSINLKGRAYSMSISGNRIVLATSGRYVTIHDIRKIATPEQVRESSLQNMLRIVRCFPNGHGYAVGSCEGRIAIEYFDVSEQIQRKKYAFKAHRKVESGRQIMYPINALAFHPKYVLSYNCLVTDFRCIK
eukprot:jgi/Bigna1/35088/e_gw1.8.67.1